MTATGFPNVAPPPPSSPWQRLYGLGHRLRRRYWATRAARLPLPVVSIGNLHWGGSGKTPVVAAVAAHLRDAGRRVAILSRGYGREDAGVRLVSRGEGPLLGPSTGGDEPVLLAGLLPGVAVVVAGDRHRAGLHALQRLDPPPDLFLLDDGFSHLRLARDLDLLVFPAVDPFGGGRLAPAGRLREPLAASAAAHAALASGPDVAPGDGDRLARSLRPHGFAGPGFACPIRVGAPRFLDGSSPPAGARVLAVSGVARPESFLAALREAGLEIAGAVAFPDHHRYPDPSLARIREAAEAAGAAIVATTAKDRVKLQGRLDLPLVELPWTAEPEPAFFRWLDVRLAELAVRR